MGGALIVVAIAAGAAAAEMARRTVASRRLRRFFDLQHSPLLALEAASDGGADWFAADLLETPPAAA